MRKRFLPLLAVLLCFLTSCGKLPDMRELLAYQEEPIMIEMRIKDEETFCGRVTLDSDAVTLMLTEPAQAEGIVFTRLDDGTLTISYEDVTHELPAGNLSKASAWLSLFTLSPDGIWKIEQDTMGGISVFICTENETGITLYIDAATFLPLKLVKGELSIDVIAVSR